MSEAICLAKKDPSVAFAAGFMQPLSDAITSYANIAVAQANANAAIISAQQKTQQAALAVNAPIIHELDRAFFSFKGKMGRGKNAPLFNLDLSVLSAYALGDMLERIMADMKDYNQGLDPGWFSKEWDDVRTPRTQISGSSTNSQIGEELTISKTSAKGQGSAIDLTGKGAAESFRRGFPIILL